MNREKQLIKNTIIVAIGKICTQFISFFLLPLYTSYLTTGEYGTVDLLNTYVSLLIPVIFLQMDQSIFRHLIDIRNNEEKKKKYISTSIIVVLTQSILFFIFYIFVSKFINNDYKYFLAIIVVLTMFSNLLLQISRGLGDNLSYSTGSLISGLSTVFFNIILIIIFKIGAYGMLFATIFGNFLSIIYLLFKNRIHKYFSIKCYDNSIRKELWKYSIPLVPNQLSWWVINASDRTIITQILGVGINGIYSAANKFSSICITLFSIFNLTWSESAALHVKDADSDTFFSNILNTSLKLFVSLCLGIISFMPFVFKFLITGEGYSNAYYQIPILLLSTIFNIVVSLLGAIYIAYKKSDKIAKTAIVAAIINISTNLIMIRYIGLFAASISTLIAYFSMAVYRYFDVQKYVKIKFDKKFIFISVFITFLIVYLYYARNIILCILGVLTSIVFALYFNKEIINSTIKSIKKFFIK